MRCVSTRNGSGAIAGAGGFESLGFDPTVVSTAVSYNLIDTAAHLAATSTQIGNSAKPYALPATWRPVPYAAQSPATGVSLQPGETKTLEFTPAQAVTYQIVCNIAGHKEAGMVGELDVK